MAIDKKAIIEAIEHAKNTSKKRGFRQSLDLILTLRDIDLKKPENRITEFVELPYPPKEEIKITIFATGDLALRAREAGAETVLGIDDLNALRGDKKKGKQLSRYTDFFLAETTMMASVGRIMGPILGPKGKMPTPVHPGAAIGDIINRHKKTVRLRVRDQLTAQCRIGTENMPASSLAENIQVVLNRLENRLDKGLMNIRGVYVKTSMGSPVKIVM